MLQMVVPSELWLRRHTILLIRSSTTSLTSSEKTATSRGRIISCLSTLRILSQSSPSLKYKTQDVRQPRMVKRSLFRRQGQKVAEDSRRDEAGGTSPHVSVLLPWLHVSSLRGHTLSPQHLSYKVTVSHRDDQLGPKPGLENFAVHLTVLHLQERRDII